MRYVLSKSGTLRPWGKRGLESQNEIFPLTELADLQLQEEGNSQSCLRVDLRRPNSTASPSHASRKCLSMNCFSAKLVGNMFIGINSVMISGATDFQRLSEQKNSRI